MGDMEEGAKRPWKAGREPLIEGEKPVKVTLNLTRAQHTALKEAGSIGGTIRQLVDQWMARRAKKVTPKKR